MQDQIKREIIIQSTKERIYDAIANPEQVVKWFPTTVEGEYLPGKQPVFSFGEHGKNRIYVVEANPYEYFAYRWVPGGNHFLGDVLSVKTTLVEFTIADQGDGSCKVVLSESGFASLPAEIMESSFEQNSGGWNFMLGRLEEYFQAGK